MTRGVSLAAQWLEYLTGVRKVTGSIHVGDSVIFSLFHVRDSINTTCYNAKGPVKFECCARKEI